MALRNWLFGRRPAEPAPDALADAAGIVKQLVERVIRLDASQSRALADAGNKIAALEAAEREAREALRDVKRALDAQSGRDARRRLLALVGLDTDCRRLEAAGGDALHLLGGYRLVRARLHEALEREGLEARDATGGPYDPRWHELVTRVGGPENVVVEIFQPAYAEPGAERPLVRAKVAVGDGTTQGESTPWTP